MISYVCIFIFLMIPCIATADATVYLKDGGRIDCESFWQEGDEIKIRIDAKSTMGFPKNSVDMKKTFTKIKTPAIAETVVKQQNDESSNNAGSLKSINDKVYPLEPEEFKRIYNDLLLPFDTNMISYSASIIEAKQKLIDTNNTIDKLDFLLRYYRSVKKVNGGNKRNLVVIINYIENGTNWPVGAKRTLTTPVETKGGLEAQKFTKHILEKYIYDRTPRAPVAPVERYRDTRNDEGDSCRAQCEEAYLPSYDSKRGACKSFCDKRYGYRSR